MSILVFSLGCASTQNDTAQIPGRELTPEAVSALSAISGNYSKTEMDEAKLKKAAKDIQSDKEAQSAVKVLTDTMEGKSASIKYSPVTGKRYSGDMEFDPETGAKLLPLEP